MITLICGRSGMGKTCLAKTLLHEHRKKLIVLDVNNEYKEFGKLTIDSFKELHDRIAARDFPIRFFSSNFEEFFVLLKYVKNFTLMIDELQIIATPTNCPKSFMELIQRHRHLPMDFFGAAQRISSIKVDVRSQAHRIITFQQTDYQDLQIVKKAGFDPDAVCNLKKFKYIIKEY